VIVKGRHDTQHNDIQHNDTQHNDIQHNDTQHNDIQHNDTSTKGLFVTLDINGPQQNNIMLNVIMLSAVFYLLLR
jgi:hypothetical protein